MAYFLDLKENPLAAFYKAFYHALYAPFTRKKGGIFPFSATTTSKSNGYKL